MSRRAWGAWRSPDSCTPRPSPCYKALDLDEGDRFRERALRDGVRAVEDKLHEAGFFEARVTAREPAWDPATHHVDITVQVVEGPHTKVEFTGREALSEKALRERLTFADARVVDEVEVRASAEQIERAYREKGYPDVRVTGTLGGDAAERTVTFAVAEGPRVRVESITFEGVTGKLESDLREQMRTRPTGLSLPGRPRGLYVEETLTEDMRTLRRYLRSQGYAQAEVGPPRTTFSEDRTLARIVIPVVSGPRHTVDAVSVTGNRVFTTDQILKVVALRRGDPWDPTKADEARRKVEQFYQRRGYFRTVVSAKVTEVGDGVTVAFDLVEGELTRVGRVLISGLTATRRRRGGARAADQAGRFAQRGRPQRDPAPARRHTHLRPGRRRGAGRHRRALPRRPDRGAGGQAVALRVRRRVRHGRGLPRFRHPRQRQPVRDRPERQRDPAREREGQSHRAAVPSPLAVRHGVAGRSRAVPRAQGREGLHQRSARRDVHDPA